MLLLKQHAFKAHWFETGTPPFLVALLKQQPGISVMDIEQKWVREDMFSTYEIENLDPMALLFQTGYLTIRTYNAQDRLYQLGFPNFEVKDSLMYAMLTGFSEQVPTMAGSSLEDLLMAIRRDDLHAFFDTLKIFFANVPYTIQLKNENYYQTIFYLIFTLMGLRIQVEVTTNRGRIDAVVETNDVIYVFEFKLTGTAEEALAQIQEKGYAEKYRDGKKKIRIFGVSFDPTERNVGRWVEQLQR